MDRPAKPTSRAVAGMTAVMLLTLFGCTQAPQRPADPSKLLERAKSFKRHRLYHLGPSFEGLPLTAAPDARGGPASGNPAVDFIYGTCDPPGGLFRNEGGCTPPLSVQSWSACERYIALLDISYRQMRIRGVPAADVDGDTRLELQTGDITIVIFANTRERARRAADALRSLDGGVGPEEDLPPPVRGALSGRPAGWRQVAASEPSGAIRCVRNG